VRRRLLVRPGITGLWQVSGRSDLSWDDSVRLDLYYVETACERPNPEFAGLRTGRSSRPARRRRPAACPMWRTTGGSPPRRRSPPPG